MESVGGGARSANGWLVAEPGSINFTIPWAERFIVEKCQNNW